MADILKEYEGLLLKYLHKYNSDQKPVRVCLWASLCKGTFSCGYHIVHRVPYLVSNSNMSSSPTGCCLQCQIPARNCMQRFAGTDSTVADTEFGHDVSIWRSQCPFFFNTDVLCNYISQLGQVLIQ